MRREFHVRFCEGPGVRSPRATCERHGTQRAGPAGEPEGESRPGNDWKVKVLWRP
jgi:hypothetical protein